MTIPKIKQNKERRQRLLACAIDLFVEKGYFDTPVREIINKSGFGTGTFYNYFTDKEDILKTLLEEFADQIILGVNSYYTTEKDLYKRFIETKRVTMEVFAKNEKMSEIYSRVAGTSEAIDKCLKQFEDKLIEFYIRNIEYGINKGAFNNVSVPPVAQAILAVEKYLLYKWIVLGDITKEEMVEMVISFHETLSNGLVKNK
ncbi:TetR/AcrR family transcriptional regulator [Desulfotomaculum sp. 1211_IL3151]|uniref:TetR/AcrR family transcriptional regulator n=1 Tax=Desulfotomaculum sp. 1211_IL3151 TaxID=3084055 RepID=UPI002FD92217